MSPISLRGRTAIQDTATLGVGGRLSAVYARLPYAARVKILASRTAARFISHEERLALWRSLGAAVDASAYIDASAALLFHPEYVAIGAGTLVDAEVRLHAWERITIGANVILSPETQLLTGSHDIHAVDFAGNPRPITIGDYAWLGLGSTVLPGVSIGMCAVVGARAVVTKDVAAYAVVAGNPATVVGERSHRDFTYVPAAIKLNRDWQRTITIR